jgi:O-antigen/teichoic acid export membrane protein
LRAALLLASTGNRAWLRPASTPDWRRLKSLFGVGLQFQLASLASMLRDNLHLLVVGPVFGRELAGLYAWVMQLCGITSQVFVQTASRVSLPWLLAIEDADTRWRRMLPQIVWLTVLTFPPLLCLHYIAPAANHAFFQDKWTAALGLLPFLIWRMLPGLATTPLGTMLIAQRGSGGYVSSNCTWTIAEVIVAIACMYLMGGRGLAVSYSFMAWFGVVLFATRIKGMAGVVEVLKVLLLRPSVWVATILTLPYAFVPATFRTDPYIALAYSTLVCLLSIGCEARVWEGIRRVAPRFGRLRDS